MWWCPMGQILEHKPLILRETLRGRRLLILLGLALSGCTSSFVETPTVEQTTEALATLTQIPSETPTKVSPTQSPATTATAISVTPTATALPVTMVAADSGIWNTFESRQYGFAIDFPSDMRVVENHTASWMLVNTGSSLDGLDLSFAYVSVIPVGFQSGGGDIYNFNTREAEVLWGLAVGETRSLVDDPESRQWFTYHRFDDVSLAGQMARRIENSDPWEAPIGTEEIRFYLFTADHIYLVGAYANDTDSTNPLLVTRDRFNSIAQSFRLISTP